MKCKTLGIGMLLTGLAFTCQTNGQEPTSSESGSSEVVVDDQLGNIFAEKAVEGVRADETCTADQYEFRA